MTPCFDLGAPVDTATDRSPPGPIGTWTIDHAHSGVALTWRRLRLGTVTGRLHCLGIIHLDDLPPVGVVRFLQPSGLDQRSRFTQQRVDRRTLRRRAKNDERQQANGTIAQKYTH